MSENLPLLVERLRAERTRWAGKQGWLIPPGDEICAMCDEAADEIERLQLELADTREAYLNQSARLVKSEGAPHTDTDRLERICNVVLRLVAETKEPHAAISIGVLNGLKRLAQAALDASRAERATAEPPAPLETLRRVLLEHGIDTATFDSIVRHWRAAAPQAAAQGAASGIIGHERTDGMIEGGAMHQRASVPPAAVKRYDWEDIGTGYSSYRTLTEQPGGDWVKFDDVEPYLRGIAAPASKPLMMTENQQPEETRLSCADRHPLHSDTELVQRWLRAQQPAKRPPSGTMLWAKVSQQFCVDSTSAQDICRRHGHDPDLLIRKRRYG